MQHRPEHNRNFVVEPCWKIASAWTVKSNIPLWLFLFFWVGGGVFSVVALSSSSFQEVMLERTCALASVRVLASKKRRRRRKREKRKATPGFVFSRAGSH